MSKMKVPALSGRWDLLVAAWLDVWRVTFNKLGCRRCAKVIGHAANARRRAGFAKLRALHTDHHSEDIVQVRNPRTDRYIKIDRGKGKIIGEKENAGPYDGVPIVPHLRGGNDAQ